MTRSRIHGDHGVPAALALLVIFALPVFSAFAAPAKRSGLRRLFATSQKRAIPDHHHATLGRLREQSSPNVSELYRALSEASKESSGKVKKGSEFYEHLSFADKQLTKHWIELEVRNSSAGRAEAWAANDIVAAAILTTTTWKASRIIAAAPRLSFDSDSARTIKKQVKDARQKLELALEVSSKNWADPTLESVEKEQRQSFETGLLAFATAGLDPWKPRDLRHETKTVDKYVLRAVEMNNKAWRETREYAERSELLNETLTLLSTLRTIDARYIHAVQQRVNTEAESLISEGIAISTTFMNESKQRGFERSAEHLRRILPAFAATCAAKPSPQRDTLLAAFESTLGQLNSLGSTPHREEVLSQSRLIADIGKQISPVEAVVPAGLKRVFQEFKSQATRRLRAEYTTAVSNSIQTVHNFFEAGPPKIERVTSGAHVGKNFWPWSVDGRRGNERTLLNAIAPHWPRYRAAKKTLGWAKELATVAKELEIELPQLGRKLAAGENSLRAGEAGFSRVCWKKSEPSVLEIRPEIVLHYSRTKYGPKRKFRIAADGQEVRLSEKTYEKVSALFSRKDPISLLLAEYLVKDRVYNETARKEVLKALKKLKGKTTPIRVTIKTDGAGRKTPVIANDQKGFKSSVARVLLKAEGLSLSREDIVSRLPKTARLSSDLETLSLLLDIEIYNINKLVGQLALEQTPKERFGIEAVVAATATEQPGATGTIWGYRLVRKKPIE